jgi:hypothetical protein
VERVKIIAKAIQNACNAKGPENRAINCHVQNVAAKDLINNKFFQMNNVGNNIRKSLLKSQDALNGFKAKRKAFFLAKEEIIKEIEEAREIWKNTLDQLPNQEFKY